MKFRIGDIIRCTNKNYKITSFKRPCKVVQEAIYGKILVKPFDFPYTMEVEDKFFEIMPYREILEDGQEISVEGFDKPVIFKSYMDNGFIKVKTKKHYKDVEISKVIY